MSPETRPGFTNGPRFSVGKDKKQPPAAVVVETKAAVVEAKVEAKTETKIETKPVVAEIKVEIKKAAPEVVKNPDIIETEDSISYVGVKLQKAEKRDGLFVPDRRKYADYINDPELSLPLQRDIAVSWLQGDPMLIEGGTSLGKTTTIRKMAAELGYEVHYVNLNGATDIEDLMGRYVPNAQKKGPTDPEYVFVDGKVTSGLRKEPGKKKVIILDEYNAAAPNISIRLHEVMDALERSSDVVLAEDASESISTDKKNTLVVALANPPGNGFLQREPFDPAQIRRWVYHKLPGELPDTTFNFSTKALFGLDVEAAKPLPKEKYLVARETALPLDELKDIPGIAEILTKYQEFHRAAKGLLTHRLIAADQPQPFTYDDRMEPRRVRDFILRFYKGDLNETTQQALRYYYGNKLETTVDRKKVEELVRAVESKAATNSKRKGLDTVEIPGILSIERAREIMGQNMFGPSEVEKAFGWKINPGEVPLIPFSAEELEKANKNGFILILRTDKDPLGNPLTAQNIENRKPILNPTCRADISAEKFFTDQRIKKEWRIVASSGLELSRGQTYLEETKALRTYLGALGKLTSAELAECTDDRLAKMDKSDPKKFGPAIANLIINRNHRRTFVEALYDASVVSDKMGAYPILRTDQETTKNWDSEGRIVLWGYTTGGKIQVYRHNAVVGKLTHSIVVPML